MLDMLKILGGLYVSLAREDSRRKQVSPSIGSDFSSAQVRQDTSFSPGPRRPNRFLHKHNRLIQWPSGDIWPVRFYPLWRIPWSFAQIHSLCWAGLGPSTGEISSSMGPWNLNYCPGLELPSKPHICCRQSTHPPLVSLTDDAVRLGIELRSTSNGRSLSCSVSR